MDRRSFIGSLALAALSGSAGASDTDRLMPMLDSVETIALWPGTPPGGKAAGPSWDVQEQSSDPNAFHDRLLTKISRPALCRFPAASPDGSALLIVPGGGYRELWVDKEGFEPARRFNQAGVTCFVLIHRLPREGWDNPTEAPIEDAQRAMRLIRANSGRYGLDPARVGVLGFSAGGHLAASLCARAGASFYKTVDSSDTLSAKPSFAALLYPVITMLAPYAHEASRETLLGERASRQLRESWSCERLVTRNAPPMFLASAADDPDVAPENTLEMLAALHRAEVPAEMHLFERGSHGFGIRTGANEPVAVWPDLLLRWGVSHGIFRS